MRAVGEAMTQAFKMLVVLVLVSVFVGMPISFVLGRYVWPKQQNYCEPPVESTCSENLEKCGDQLIKCDAAYEELAENFNICREILKQVFPTYKQEGDSDVPTESE